MVSNKDLKKEINLLNDPLLNSKFLRGAQGRIIINLYAALIDKKIIYRKKAKLVGSPFLVGISDLFEKYMDKINFEDFCVLYRQYLNVPHLPKSNIKKLIEKWIKNDRIPFPMIRLISILHENDEIIITFITNFNYLTDRNGQSKFKPPYLLKDILNPKRLYDIGVSMGDGGIFNHEQVISDGSLEGKELHLV